MKALILVFAAGISGVMAQPAAPAQGPRSMRVGPGSYLGVMVEEIDSQRAQSLKLPGDYGVEVTRVVPGSPAEGGGLKVGDAIVEYNGQRVEGMEEFQRLVRETPVGRDVKLDIVRNGAPQTLTVKTGSRGPQVTMQFPGGPTLTTPFEMRMPDIPRSFMTWRSTALGIEVEALEGQLAQYFGVKEGVLVRTVGKGSVAETAGIKAGDVITRVDGGNVATPADLSSRIRASRGRQVPLTIERDHREMTVNVTVDDNDRPQW
jgi:serine protease Do